MRSSPKRLWRTGFFVIEAMLTGGLVARRKALTKSTEYPVLPVEKIWGLNRMFTKQKAAIKLSYALIIMNRYSD